MCVASAERWRSHDSCPAPAMPSLLSLCFCCSGRWRENGGGAQGSGGGSGTRPDAKVEPPHGRSVGRGGRLVCQRWGFGAKAKMSFERGWYGGFQGQFGHRLLYWGPLNPEKADGGHNRSYLYRRINQSPLSPLRRETSLGFKWSQRNAMGRTPWWEAISRRETTSAGA